MLQALLRICALFLAFSAAAHADPASTWTIQGENDSISTTVGGSDKFYSSGLRLGWTSGTDLVPEAAQRIARIVWGDGTTRIGFNITHQIYTPSNIFRPIPNPRDRPQAAYLAGTFSLLQDTDTTRSVLALSLGVIGPSALGRQVQNGFHELIRIRTNEGWAAQLPDEPQADLLAERTWRIGLARHGAIETDMLPSLTAGLGTVRTYLQTGIILRLGQGLHRDFGVARIHPGITGGDVFAADPGFAWYVFGGLGGQLVARDAFLDNFNAGTLQSDMMASVLTERLAKVRVLGQSKDVLLNPSCFLVVAGNAVMLSEDLVRRLLVMELDARTADPEARLFTGDFLAEVKARRAELLGAALTIWRRAQLHSGRIARGLALGSYQQWCGWVRDALVALGAADPVARVATIKAADTKRQDIAELFETWHAHHGERPMRATALDAEVKAIIDPHGRGRQLLVAELAKRIGTRMAGMMLTCSKPSGNWSRATYAVVKTLPLE